MFVAIFRLMHGTVQFSGGLARWSAMRLAVVLVLAACSPQQGDPRGTGACAHGDEMPSDRAIAACVSERRAELTTLVAMAERDMLAVGTDRIGDCWRLSGDRGCGGLDAALRRAGMSAEHHGGVTTIALSRAGIVPSGASKNLVCTVADRGRYRPRSFDALHRERCRAGWWLVRGARVEPSALQLQARRVMLDG
jgi:hypothetical protein